MQDLVEAPHPRLLGGQIGLLVAARAPAGRGADRACRSPPPRPSRGSPSAYSGVPPPVPRGEPSSWSPRQASSAPAAHRGRPARRSTPAARTIALPAHRRLLPAGPSWPPRCGRDSHRARRRHNRKSGADTRHARHGRRPPSPRPRSTASRNRAAPSAGRTGRPWEVPCTQLPASSRTSLALPYDSPSPDGILQIDDARRIFSSPTVR